MGLKLHAVTPRQGWTWMRDGLRLYFRRPIAFTGLFLVFLLGAMLLMTVPVAGGVLGLATLPLLTLGFRIATRAALRDEPMGPMLFVDALRPGSPGRGALLKLCLGYGLVSVGVLMFCHWFDDGAFERLQFTMANAQATRKELEAALGDPLLLEGLLLRAGLITVISIPYWHAPALVRWGGQSASQALFSSTLALWRARGAFLVYGLGWTVAVSLFGVIAALLVSLLGLRQLLGAIGLPAGLIFSTAFYVSLWFTFVDSFGSEDEASASMDMQAPTTSPPA
jgi:hypothetical protein